MHISLSIKAMEPSSSSFLIFPNRMFPGGMIKLPDTPQSRQLISDWNRQKERRVSTQHILFSSTSTKTSSTSRAAGAAVTGVTNPQRESSDSFPSPTIKFPPSTPPFPQRPHDTIDVSIASEPHEISEPAVFNQHITTQIISGSGGSHHVTSRQVFSSRMALSDLRQQFPSVYEAKKNRCTTTPSLFSHIAENEKHVVLPSNQSGQQLRSILNDFVTTVSAEFHTTAQPNSELLLCALSKMQIPGKCFLNQFHCAITCTAENFETFEDECSRGLSSTIQVDSTTPVELLHGFNALSASDESPLFLYRLTTALTDYMASVSNSELQKRYITAKNIWSSIKLKSGMKAAQFVIDEKEAFDDFTFAAAAAQRTVPTPLDRGISVLASLPDHIKISIDKRSRKFRTPENFMDRNWVMTQIGALEDESDPEYSWMIPPSQQLCRRFANNGQCLYGDQCRYKHVPKVQADLEAALTCNTSSLPVQPPTDLMEYDCKLKCSPGCTKTFKESPSKWTSMTTTGGTAFQVPKSCKPCRDHDKAIRAGTVAALIVASPFDDYQSDFDEETYANELYDSHSLSMSDSLQT